MEGGVVVVWVVYCVVQCGQCLDWVVVGVELQVGELGFWQYVLQVYVFGDVVLGVVGLVDLCSVVQFVFQVVVGDVWCGDQVVCGQFGVGLWFVFLDVQCYFQVGVVFEQVVQGLVVDYCVMVGVDQLGVGMQGGQVGFIQQVVGWVFVVVVQWSVQVDYVGFGQQLFQ